MSIDEIIRNAEKIRDAQIASAPPKKPTDNPPKKTRFDSRQYER